MSNLLLFFDVACWFLSSSYLFVIKHPHLLHKFLSVAVIPQPEATYRTKSVLGFMIPDRWVCHAREAWQQAAGIATGTESGDLTYQPQTQSIVCKQDLGRSLKLSNPTPSDILPPTRQYLLNHSQSANNWEKYFQIWDPRGENTHLNNYLEIVLWDHLGMRRWLSG